MCSKSQDSSGDSGVQPGSSVVGPVMRAFRGVLQKTDPRRHRISRVDGVVRRAFVYDVSHEAFGAGNPGFVEHPGEFHARGACEGLAPVVGGFVGVIADNHDLGRGGTTRLHGLLVLQGRQQE